MEDQLITDPPEKTPEEIEAEMTATRESLTEKIAALENQVLGTVQTAADTITDTVDAVKSFINSAPENVEHVAEAVKERVQRTFDISDRVREHPWTSVSIAMGVGCLASVLFSGREPATGGESKVRSAPPPDSPFPTHPTTTPKEPGLFDDVAGIVGRRIREKIRETTITVIDSVSGSLNQSVRELVPELFAEATRKLMPEREEHGFYAAARIYGK